MTSSILRRAGTLGAAFLLTTGAWAGATVAAVGTAAVPAAFAQNGPPGGGNRGNRGMERVLESLGLSDQQKSQIRSIMTNARKQAQTTTDPQQRRQTFRTAMDQVRNVLTPAQRQQFDAKVKAMRNRRGGPNGNH